MCNGHMNIEHMHDDKFFVSTHDKENRNFNS